MSATLKQIYDSDPITTNIGTDLMYFSRAPYASGDDRAMSFADFSDQFPTPVALQDNTFTYAAVNGGSANAYTATMDPPLTAYADGQEITINAAFTNTNSVSNVHATLDVDGIGASTIFIQGLDGTAYPAFAGAMQQNYNYRLAFNTVVSGWILQNPSSQVTGEVLTNQAWIYSADVGIANAYDITVPLVIADPVFGNPPQATIVKFKAANASSAASTLTVNGVTNPLVKNDGAAGSLTTEIKQNAFYEAQFDTTFGWVLINPASTGGGGGSPWSAGAGAGSAVGGDGSAISLGNYTLVYGDTNCSASADADNSFICGTGCTSESAYSFVLGYLCQAQGIGASAPFCMGNQCVTGSGYNFAFGAFCQALGTFSFAMGTSSVASSNYGRAWGNGVTAGIGCFVAGDRNSCSLASTGGDQFVLGFDGGYYFYRNTSGSPELAVHFDAAGNLINLKGTADQSKSVQNPSTGDSITIADNSKTLVLDPAGTLATLTVTMPPTPVDGQEIRVSSSQIVTALTVSPNSGQTLSNAPTTILAGTGFAYIYDLPNTNWYRIY